MISGVPVYGPYRQVLTSGFSDRSICKPPIPPTVTGFGSKTISPGTDWYQATRSSDVVPTPFASVLRS